MMQKTDICSSENGPLSESPSCIVMDVDILGELAGQLKTAKHLASSG